MSTLHIARFTFAAALLLQGFGPRLVEPVRPVPGRMAEQKHMRYRRAIQPGDASRHDPQVCAVLGPDVFAHAAPSLRDLRLYDTIEPKEGSIESKEPEVQPREIPYAVTVSEPATVEDERATVLNQGLKAGGSAAGETVSLDLQMPDRPYTEVALEMSPIDFLATAHVFGRPDEHGSGGTDLGTFTLFNLASQTSGSNTVLRLQESTFRYLHIELTLEHAPGALKTPFTPTPVNGATVPPSRRGQAIFVPVTAPMQMTAQGSDSVATFSLPAQIPIERIRFAVGGNFTANFSRSVTIRADATPALAGGQKSEPEYETATGRLQRVRLEVSGRQLDDEELTIPTTLELPLQAATQVTVRVANGNDQPIPLTVVLEMRERRLCFAPTPAAPTLFYGDATLPAPIYDYARLTTPSTNPVPATLAAEDLNPDFAARVEKKPMSERHPELLWLALLAVIAVLGTVALRAARRV